MRSPASGYAPSWACQCIGYADWAYQTPCRLLINASTADDLDNAVDVVGHDDEFMQSDIGAHGFGFEPFVMGNFADGIQVHLAVGNAAE